jgi:hypothetical protein
MRYGSPYASGHGNPENHYEYVIQDTAELARRGYTSLPVRFKLRSSPVMYPCFHHLYLNGKKQKTIYDADGSEKTATLSVPNGATSISVLALRVGVYGNPLYEINRVARAFESTENKRVTLAWTFEPKIIEPEQAAGSYTSAWSLSGLQQGVNCAYVNGKPTWGRISFTLAVSGGVVTVTLTVGTRTIATGSATILGAPFSVTLAESDDSGVSGSVTVDNTVADTTGGILDIRWPTSMRVKRDTSDPPSTVVATVNFTGDNSVRWPEPSELAAGTYYYRLQPVSDTGQAGTETASVTVIVIGAPVAPTNFAYSSGASNAIVFGFNNSTTAGATYRLYGPTAVGGVADMNTPIATQVAGVAGAANTIGPVSIGAGATGTARFILRAVNGGIEERVGQAIEVEFSAGTRIAPRPNTPGFVDGSAVITSGVNLSVKGIYDPTRERGTATQLQLFVKALGGAYAGTPDATGSLTSTANGLKTATLAYTLPGNGYYYIKLLAATAGGVQSPADEPIEMLIFASTESLPAPTSFSGELSRS